MLSRFRKSTLVAVCSLALMTSGAGTLLWSAGDRAAAQGAKRTLVVSGFGGLWERSVRETVIKPFEQKYPNVEVIHTLPGGFSEVIAKLRAEKGKPTIDVVSTGGGFERIKADQELLEDFDVSKMPNLRDVYKGGIYKNRVVANSIAGVGLAYHKQRVPTPPTSWLDLWDPKFGQVAVSDISDTFGRALFARVNELVGGSQLNQGPGWGKFKELMTKRRPLINLTTDDTIQAIVARGAAVSVAPNSRAILLMKEGYPLGFVFPKEGAFAWGTFMGIASGSANKDLAMAFINFWLDPETQARFCAMVNYGPANLKAKMPRDYQYAQYLVLQNTLAKAYVLDFDYMNQNAAKWNERWTLEVLPLLRN